MLYIDEVIEKVVTSLNAALLSGTGFNLSEVRDAVNDQLKHEKNYNYQAKSQLNIKGMPLNSLLQRGGTNLCYLFQPYAVDIAAKVRSVDIIREAALISRDES